ncbi:hypothetical protein CMV30_14110 [Nibricoccus aquaticus]|uniref:DUF4398 domain-containing protein n=1 Tax=Nibricoccus aquaticus TaxID=2576891 RepID=A0A290Q9R9_9BACT|nr:hypothetical protein [Nibricoccus aquaticus]ATC65007.1 hypothetical protein CMV30_14110 [Nibricoccus aquaticus]
MKSQVVLALVLFTVAGALCGCGSTKYSATGVDKKAEELLRNGSARDMAEARQMAEDYYWLENARKKEEDARLERQKAAEKKEQRR